MYLSAVLGSSRQPASLVWSASRSRRGGKAWRAGRFPVAALGRRLLVDRRGCLDRQPRQGDGGSERVYLASCVFMHRKPRLGRPGFRVNSQTDSSRRRLMGGRACNHLPRSITELMCRGRGRERHYAPNFPLTRFTAGTQPVFFGFGRLSAKGAMNLIKLVMIQQARLHRRRNQRATQLKVGSVAQMQKCLSAMRSDHIMPSL